MRLKKAESEARKLLSMLNLKDKSILELALAMLYLGEGAKGDDTSIGNSNPLILIFFINGLINVYGFDITKIRCELHLRADQNPRLIKEFWSETLKLPLSCFSSISVDKRTIGSITYPTYNGVCVLRCGNIAIQRKLLHLGRLFCEEIAHERAVSSVGRASD